MEVVNTMGGGARGTGGAGATLAAGSREWVLGSGGVAGVGGEARVRRIDVLARVVPVDLWEPLDPFSMFCGHL